jgi:dihydrofolate reductase
VCKNSFLAIKILLKRINLSFILQFVFITFAKKYSKMKVFGVVAASDNNVIGVGQDIPWHLPNDFKYFKATTLDHYILMGRKTWDTFVKPLPRRKHVVISKTLKSGDMPKDVSVFEDVRTAIDALKLQNVEQLFIIGGGEIYNQTIDLMDGIYMTRVHANIENGTAFFPEISPKVFKLVTEEKMQKDYKHQYDYSFQYWERI